MYGQFGHENLQNMSFINKCIKSPKISSIDPPWYPDFKKHKIVQFGSLFGEKMAMVVTRGHKGKLAVSESFCLISSVIMIH